MSTSTYAPRPTISVAATGPSLRLAYLRALLAKTHVVLTIGWAAVRRGVAAVWRLPRAVADATLAILATDRGYTTLTGMIGSALRAAGRMLACGLRWTGRTAVTATHRTADLVGLALPGVGQSLARGVAVVQRHTTRAFDALEHTVEQACEVIGLLTGSDLVRGVTTRLAAAASGLLAAHLITQGALATKFISAIPATVGLIAWATNPWLLLATLGAAYLTTVAFAGIRLWRTGTPGPVNPDGGWTPGAASTEADQAFASIVSRLKVVIAADGSVRVDGIPADLPESDQRDLAAAAARAAVSHLDRVARRGHALSSAQRRAASRAAKTAARDWLADTHLATA